MFRLGPFEIEHPFILAPMAGVTDSPFRRVMRHRQAALMISELLSVTAIFYNNEQTCEMAQFHQEEHPLGIQIYGCDCELLCQGAKFAQDQGAAFVDLNLGCSVPKVVKKGGGAALARDVDKLAQILAALVRAVNIPVTIKLRLGWNAESYLAPEIVHIAEDVGITWATIHGRTSSQGYSGTANWELIGEIKSKSKIPIIGNGDITTPEIACERLKKYGVDAVMIGRGCLKNPFIFRQASQLWQGQNYDFPTCQDYLDLLTDHRQCCEQIYHIPHAVMAIRKFLVWYTTAFPGCHHFRAEIFRIKDWNTAWKFARDFFADLYASGEWEKHREWHKNFEEVESQNLEWK